VLNSGCAVQRVKRALVGAVVISLSVVLAVSGGAHARAAEWPLEFTWEQMPLIPGNAGMAYFKRKWRNPRGHRDGDMIVTDDQLLLPGWPTSTSPYKVLHEATNYVLLATRVNLIDGSKITTFVIFNLMHSLKKKPEAPIWPTLREHWCTERNMERPEPFDWPVKKLLEVFKASKCLKIIPDDAWYADIHWASDRWTHSDL
jgi:hypothetical protein